MPDAQLTPRTAMPASIARRRRLHHREFPAGYSSAGCSQQSPLPLRRPRQCTTGVHPGTIDAGEPVLIFCLTHGVHCIQLAFEAIARERRRRRGLEAL
jgi:hypothetical protein